MPSWSHLIRFVAVEDGCAHLGQLVDTTRDVGEDSVEGVKIQAFAVEGTVFDGQVTQEVLTVEKVCEVLALLVVAHICLTYLTASLPSDTRTMQLYPMPGFELQGPCEGTSSS